MKPTTHTEEEHPALAAARRAPVGEPFAPELKAFLDQQLADIKAGRTPVFSHEEVMAGFPGLRDADDGDEP